LFLLLPKLPVPLPIAADAGDDQSLLYRNLCGSEIELVNKLFACSSPSLRDDITTSADSSSK
jgi:hypothetical protein